ncbi:hypothetical protein Tco_1342622, partial [Tanacetum coccineum]
IKDRKCKTRGGLSRPFVKRKLAPGSSNSRATRAKTSSSKEDAPFLTVSDDDEGLPDVFELKDATDCDLKISAITPPTCKNHLDNHMDVELLDVHDRCYARQAMVNNDVNMRSCELLQVIEKLRGEIDVMRNRKRAREKECEGLRVKCEAAMTEFEKNPTMVALREKIYVLFTEVKEHKLNLDRMILESQSGQVTNRALRLWSRRREVVSKVIPYAAMELAYEQVANIKEPFDLSKVKGYRSSYKKDHTQASNDFATATFSWLDEFVADPSAPIEVLLSKKPPSLQRLVPSRTQVPLPAFQKATPSSALVSHLMSPPADASVTKPQSSPL